ncbi:hypothetical protein RBSWK_04163 [Rhodopirellula baltica SWK14]|uniref:Uncharacterized protein n=1 Tax=Rhodopirellula baltica SWK14 TaxID=993516 RepID=L7CDF2_RHOBT|nr:hypothetical protein RBSWK_04163 [Rhodopirellula baltica SWK14]
MEAFARKLLARRNRKLSHSTQSCPPHPSCQSPRRLRSMAVADRTFPPTRICVITARQSAASTSRFRLTNR